MQKIPTLFIRPEKSKLVTTEVNPECQWVINGQGVATEKIDGTACLIRDGRLYRRFDAKHGKTPPANFEPVQDAPDPITGHFPGWIPVGGSPDDQYHREAWVNGMHGESRAGDRDGTYELVGPKVQGNPYNLDRHILVRHGGDSLEIPNLTFDGIKRYLSIHQMEGIVWHHQDGRMAKIKRKDFDLPWPVK